MTRSLPGIHRYLGEMTETLDPTDWAILVEVQRDGRIPLTELGRRVNLSACGRPATTATP
jgi:hypothetical protein